MHSIMWQKSAAQGITRIPAPGIEILWCLLEVVAELRPQMALAFHCLDLELRLFNHHNAAGRQKDHHLDCSTITTQQGVKRTIKGHLVFTWSECDHLWLRYRWTWLPHFRHLHRHNYVVWQYYIVSTNILVILEVYWTMCIGIMTKNMEEHFCLYLK